METSPKGYQPVVPKLSTLEEDQRRIEAIKNTTPRMAEILAQRQQARKRIRRLREELNLPNPTNTPVGLSR